MDRTELKRAIVFVVVIAVISGLALGADEAPVRRGRQGQRLGRRMAADPNNATQEEHVRRRGLGRNRGADQLAVPNTTDETNVPGRGVRGEGFGRGRARRQQQVEQQQWNRRQGRRGIEGERYGRGPNRERNIPDEQQQGARMGRGNRLGRGRAQRQDSTQWQNHIPGETRRGLGQRRLERGPGRGRLDAERGRETVGPRARREEYGQRQGRQLGRGRGRGANEDTTSAPSDQWRRGRGRWQNRQTSDEFREDNPRERLHQRIRNLQRLADRLKQRVRSWE